MKKYKKAAMDMIGAGIIMGASASAVESVGGPTGAVTKLSGALPTMAGIMGAGIMLDQVKQLAGSTKKSKKKY